MNSDEGGYDLPESAGLGFTLRGTSQPSNVSGFNDTEEKGEDDRLSSSSNENDSDADDDDPNFAYGAYASRKRKKRERSSKVSDKERNLYGVFYESSEDDNDALHNKFKKSSRSRHFDQKSNRMAGLAFVKASSTPNSDSAPNKEKDQSGEGPIDETNLPSWLKEKKQPQNSAMHSTSTYDNGSTSKISPKTNEDADDNDEDNIDDDENLMMAAENEKRFKELIEIANKCTKPFSTMRNQKAVSKREYNERVAFTSSERSRLNKEPIPNGNELQTTAAAIGFAPVTNYGKSELDSTATGLGFAPATNSSIDNVSIMEEERNTTAGLGLGMQTKPRDDTQIDHNPGLGLGMGMGGGLGLGMGSTANNFSSLSQTMGMGLGSQMNDKPAKKRDPSLGKWEKHTKGIGMKLLQKMGYEGSGGLGAKRKRKLASETDNTTKSSTFDKNDPNKSEEEVVQKRGISRPVEVVVRPNGLGLGYGSFKEQSQLKVNRQIEAEVRGLVPEKEEAKPKEDKTLEGVPKSLLPSTQSLLDKGSNSWRTGKRSKKVKRKIVNYQEILDKTDATNSEGKIHIIDMRGPSAAQGKSPTTTTEPDLVPIGEELLHNVTLLLNTHENELRTSSYTVKSTERRLESLEEEYKDMIDRKRVIDERIAKMKFTIAVLEEIEKLVERICAMSEDSDCDKLDFAMDGLNGVLSKLHDQFSQEERASLKFESTVVPSIVKPVVEAVTNSLNPFAIDSKWMTHLAAGVDKLCITVGSDNEAYLLREIIFTDVLVPWISSAMSSSKWDPVVNVEGGINILEALLACVEESFLGAEVEENNILKGVIQREIIENIVQPKVQRAVSYWKPKLDENNIVSNPMHLWILPWLPHFRNESSLTPMLADVRRSLKKTLSFISKNEANDIAVFRSFTVTLSAWQKVFEKSTIFGLTSDIVTPRFARCLARVRIDFSHEKQSWGQITALFDYFDAGLMSDEDFLSLFEGEILSSWAHALYCTLKEEGRSSLNGTAKFYSAWKERVFGRSSKCTKSQLALRSDLMVCRHFFGGLEMIRATLESDKRGFESLLPLIPEDCNYKIALMHRSKVKEPTHTRSNVVSSQSESKGTVAVNTASFAEVVADYARQHDIDFYPKVGSNASKDGKKVFMFGNHQVYLDQNVLFTLRGSAWQPISLEQLAQACN